MAVLMEVAMFPTDVGESKSKYVAEVLKVIKSSGLEYQLTLWLPSLKQIP